MRLRITNPLIHPKTANSITEVATKDCWQMFCCRSFPRDKESMRLESLTLQFIQTQQMCLFEQLRGHLLDCIVSSSVFMKPLVHIKPASFRLIPLSATNRCLPACLYACMEHVTMQEGDHETSQGAKREADMKEWKCIRLFCCTGTWL